MCVTNTCIIIPIGVTKETVEGIITKTNITNIECIITVTVPGYENVKKSILDALNYLGKMINALVYNITISFDDSSGASKIFQLLIKNKPNKVILIGTTGSRYLFPILSMAILYYWRITNNEVYLLHGIEGDKSELIPFQGFFAPVMRLSNLQREIINMIYGTEETISGKIIMKKLRLTKSLYAVLSDLERKGLIIVKRNKIEKTFAGALFYNLIKED